LLRKRSFGSNCADSVNKDETARKVLLEERLADDTRRNNDGNQFIELFESLVEELTDGEVNPETVINKLYEKVNKLVNHIETKHHDILWKSSKPWYPRKWMLNDNKISGLLKKYRISDVLNALDKYNYLFSPTGVKHEGKYEYAAFVTDADFYKRILPGLMMAQITLQKFCARSGH